MDVLFYKTNIVKNILIGALRMNDYKVYIHTFPNGKNYIGVTCQKGVLRWRLNGNGYKTQERMFRAIKKYGWASVETKILYCGLSKSEAEEIEIKVISIYKSTEKLYGYNSNNGGNVSGRNSPETRAKISIAKKGKKMSVLARKNMSLAQTGRKQTEETKRKLSEARKGVPKTEEVKKKISKTLKSNTREMQRWRAILKKQRKPTVQCDLDGNEIARFDSISIAAHATGVCRNNINNCCLNKKGSKTAGGYTWKYENK